MPVTRWEYLTVPLERSGHPPRSPQEILNELGRDGWELVSVASLVSGGPVTWPSGAGGFPHETKHFVNGILEASVRLGAAFQGRPPPSRSTGRRRRRLRISQALCPHIDRRFGEKRDSSGRLRATRAASLNE